MTNRTNHTNCSHAKTSAARAKCRKARATTGPREEVRTYTVHTRCSNCNDINPEVDEDGYTTCCNEGTY